MSSQSALPRSRVLLAEAVGTAFLLAGVVGSGIMAARLSPTDVGLQLLQNAAATAGVLVAVIAIFGTISADFNPAVTLAAWALGHRAGRDVPAMIIAQSTLTASSPMMNRPISSEGG